MYIHLVVIDYYLVGRLFLSVPTYLGMVGLLGPCFQDEAHLGSCKLLGNEWSEEDASSNHEHDSGQSWGILCDYPMMYSLLNILFLPC